MVRYEIEILDETSRFSLRQVCRVCAVDVRFVTELVEEGIITPRGDRIGNWRFDGVAIARVHKAIRLHRDLDINLPGVALALELLARLESRDTAWR